MSRKYLLLISCLLLISVAKSQRQKSTQRGFRTGNQVTFKNSVKSPNSAVTVPKWAVDSISRLSINLLHEIHQILGSSSNIIISPLSIWSVMLMLLEASGGETETELRHVLRIKEQMQLVRIGYDRTIKAVTLNSGDNVAISSSNLLVNTKLDPPQPGYVNMIRTVYGGHHFEIDPSDQVGSTNKVNEWVYEATKHRIENLLHPNDINATQLLLANAAFFKGRWKHPFNVNNTTMDVFKNESDAVIGEIAMMRQKVVLPYGYSAKLQSQIVEIPYGEDIASMVVVLPRKTVKISTVLSLVRNMSLEDVLRDLTSEDEVDLSLPRFNVNNELILNVVLEKMGLVTMFSLNEAKFPQFPNDIHVSRVIQKAEIENSEEGTTATAATSAQLVYKTALARFQANRPFIYFIIEKRTNVVLFSGVFSVP